MGDLGKSGRRRPLLMLVLAVAAVAFYWEFVRDIDPRIAIDYFQQLPPDSDDDNAAFAFAGLAAPPSTANRYAWGYVEVIKNRDRWRRGEPRVRILDDLAADNERMYLWLPAVRRNFACWLPSAADAGGSENCLQRAQMTEVLERNRSLLQRYRDIFDNAGLYYQRRDDIGFVHAIQLSRLLAIDFWMRRDRMDAKDTADLFRFFRFWERHARNSSLSLVGTSRSISNYEVAATLLAQLTERDPELLLQYASAYGDFVASRLDTAAIDQLVKAEFRSINLEFCFFSEIGGQPVGCEQPGRNLYFKPGRTLQLLYQDRLRLDDCRDQARRARSESDAVNRDFWGQIFRRPGNFRGRGIALLTTGSMRRACALFDSLDNRAEQNQLRNLYLELRREGLRAEDIDRLFGSDRERFRITGTQRYFDWNPARRELSWSSTNEQRSYTLRYP